MACRICGHEKPLAPRRKICVDCRRQQQTDWRNANLEQERQRDRDRRDPVWERDYRLKTKYGITLAQFNDLVAFQNGACAACRDQLPADPRLIHLDHDHATKRVRGVLCQGCNLAVGHLKDDAERAERVAQYLRHHKKDPS